MRDPDALLAVLDNYEGIGPGHPAPTLYLREMVAVIRADGGSCEAWSYFYNRPVSETARIVSGRFLAG